MKILGKQEEKVWKMTCPECKTFFEFTESEGRRSGNCIFLRCPGCGKEIVCWV